MDVPNFDILSPEAGKVSGLMMGLDPTYQAQQLAKDQTRLQLRQSQLFQGGFPTDQNGNPDWGSASLKSAQAGDYASAEKFQTIGQQQSALAIAQRNAGAVGQYGGVGAAMLTGGSPSAGIRPAAGGGAIASEAGGDDYGRAPGGGYGGVGQVGAGGQGGTASAPASGQAPIKGPGGGVVPPGTDLMGIYAHSIGSIESGNRYDALGQMQANGAQAIGRYQVMSSNIGPWTKEVLGTAMSPEDFRNNPEAQDAVFKAKFGQAMEKYGSPFQAASVWFSGRPMEAAGNASDSLGTTVPGYVRKFAAGIGPAAQALRGGQGVSDSAGGQGQAAGAAAPQGGPAAPISFGGPALSSGTSSGAPIGDAEVMAARKLVAQSQNADPRTMTLDQQRTVSAATDTISRYQGQQARPASGSTSPFIPASTPAGAPAPAGVPDNVWASRNRLAAGQGTADDRSTIDAWRKGGSSNAAASGAPAPDGEAPVTNIHPGATLTPGVPLATNSSPAGGQSISFASGGSPLGVQTPQSVQGGSGTGTAPFQVSALAPAVPAGQVSMGQGGQTPAARPDPIPTTPTAPPPSLVDPSFAGQIPETWLKAGFTPGGWVNYARAQAAINGNLPFGAGKANQEAWNKIADGVAQSIDKSLQFTNEQKNARDPFSVKYEHDRDAYKEQARLAADTDPSRVAFAGAQAAAAAAGAAPYKFQTTQPVPGGPTVYRSDADLAAAGGAVKDQPAVFGQKQEALGKLDIEMQGQYQQRQIAHERIDAMNNLLEAFQSGAGADAKAAAIGAVRAAGFQIPDSATASPAAVEQFSKNASANIFSNARDMGTKVLVAELEGLAKANANPSMQPASNAAILAQQKGLLNWEDAHYQDYSTWRQANPYATDASSFETSWAKAHPVGAFVSAAKKDIAPLGAPLPAQGQLSDGQAYIVKGQKVRWDAGSTSFVPFTGTTAPTLPGQGAQGAGRGQDRQSQAQGQGQSAPPVAGARQAPDGNWYVSDPGRPGKFMMVAR